MVLQGHGLEKSRSLKLVKCRHAYFETPLIGMVFDRTSARSSKGQPDTTATYWNQLHQLGNAHCNWSTTSVTFFTGHITHIVGSTYRY